jgi:hypothetical protein
VAHLLGVFPHYFAKGGGGQLFDYLLFPAWGVLEVGHEPLVRGVSKLVEEDRLIFGCKTDLLLILGEIAVVLVIARHGLDRQPPFFCPFHERKGWQSICKEVGEVRVVSGIPSRHCNCEIWKSLPHDFLASQ